MTTKTMRTPYMPVTNALLDYWQRPDSHKRLMWATWIIWVAQRRLQLVIIDINLTD